MIQNKNVLFSFSLGEGQILLFYIIIFLMSPPSLNFLRGAIFDKLGNCMVCMQIWVFLICYLAALEVWPHSPDFIHCLCYRFSVKMSPAAL